MAKAFPSRRNDPTEELLISLGKEYTDKLQKIVESIAGYLAEIAKMEKNHDDWGDAHKLYFACEKAQKLLPVTRDLAQAISQYVEHGPIEIFVKLEIRLILAELETAIQTLERLLFSNKVHEYRFKNF
jgi:hypothetical protein